MKFNGANLYSNGASLGCGVKNKLTPVNSLSTLQVSIIIYFSKNTICYSLHLSSQQRLTPLNTNTTLYNKNCVADEFFGAWLNNGLCSSPWNFFVNTISISFSGSRLGFSSIIRFSGSVHLHFLCLWVLIYHFLNFHVYNLAIAHFTSSKL